MSILSQLHQNKHHQIAENTPFILRMRFKTNELPTRVDSINTFKQLRHIYQAMESKLAQYESFKPFEFFTKAPWAARSRLLSFDIHQMSEQLRSIENAAVIADDKIHEATQAMIDDIMDCDEYGLLGYLAVRCLGDVFGGQHLNDYNQRTFAGQKLDGQFYQSVKEQLKPISEYFKHLVLSAEEEKRFHDAADRCFQQHVNLFAQMEKSRTAVKNYALESGYTFKQTACFTLFGVTALATAGLSIYLTSQQDDQQTPFFN